MKKDNFDIREWKLYQMFLNESDDDDFNIDNPDVRWDGKFKGRELPIGTYYWVISVKETGESRRGMLNLLRK
jgi:hypothetical protein